ncbi:MAG: hypothetical protein JXB88_15180 [Spirochaetales bacterium]|nr:hypothetical protein [Spirochaetales bacterium]
MSKMFLNPGQPLSTCRNRKCEDCSVQRELNCHFNIKQLIRFILFFLPAVFIAGYEIIIFNPLYVVAWVVMFILFFGFIEIRVMCSHCPHYAEPDLKSLKCWANYGSPKLWKYRPGPMSGMEKIIFFAGILIIFGYPLPFFILNSTTISYILLIIYIAFIVLASISLKKYYCSYCINFACPLNNIRKEIREEFFAKNPIIQEAWKKERI